MRDASTSSQIGVPGSVRSSAISVLLAQCSGGFARTSYRISEIVRISKGSDKTVLYELILKYKENTELNLKGNTKPFSGVL